MASATYLAPPHHQRWAATGPVQQGQTAGIGFWHNKNGQALIRSLNGGTGTQLGDWLAPTFVNLFGGQAGKTNAQVAAYYQGLFAVRGQKLEAQVLATALATYVTNESLAGTTAAAYGFLVTADGVGSATFNVGTGGAAFGLPDGTETTVLNLLLAVNEKARTGVRYAELGEALRKALRDMANKVFDDLNQAGNIG